MTDSVASGLQPDVRASLERQPARDSRGNAEDARPPTLAAVYARHSGFVWRSVRRMGVPDEAVEDVMHEVFLVVHRRLPEFDGRAALTTWLYHVARGVVSNWRRGRQREERRLRLVSPPPAESDPESLARRGQAVELVRRFIDSLDADKRLVFELAEVEGLSMPEIAEIAGIKLNTAYSRLRLARKEFQRTVTELRRAENPPRGGRR